MGELCDWANADPVAGATGPVIDLVGDNGETGRVVLSDDGRILPAQGHNPSPWGLEVLSRRVLVEDERWFVLDDLDRPDGEH